MGVIKAWEWLADKWDYPAGKDSYGDLYVMIVTHNRRGLCESVRSMEFHKMISSATAKTMNDAIKANRPNGVHPNMYYYPTDYSGAKKRAKFCRKMIEYHKKIAIKLAKKMGGLK